MFLALSEHIYTTETMQSADPFAYLENKPKCFPGSTICIIISSLSFLPGIKDAELVFTKK